jgi:hypothetical protein
VTPRDVTYVTPRAPSPMHCRRACRHRAATKMLQKLGDGQTVTLYDRGFRLGFMGKAAVAGTVDGVAYLNNHLR